MNSIDKITNEISITNNFKFFSLDYVIYQSYRHKLLNNLPH